MELPSVTGIGRFRAAMALYEDGSFLTPFGLNPILQHDQTMYIGVFLLDKMTGGDNRKLVLKNCWASPSNSSNDEIKAQFLSESYADGLSVYIYSNRLVQCVPISVRWEPKKFSLIDRPGCSDHEMVKIIENGETTQVMSNSSFHRFIPLPCWLIGVKSVRQLTIKRHHYRCHRSLRENFW